LSLTLEEIAQKVDGKLEGDGSATVKDVAEIQNAEEGEISFLENPKYAKYVETTNAEAIFVKKDFEGDYKNLIRVENPELAFSKVLEYFRPSPPIPEPGISESASIADSAILGVDIYIGPNVVIQDEAVIENKAIIKANSFVGRGSRVGAESFINSNVSVYNDCKLSENVTIHSGTVIGSDGYGYSRTAEGIEKIPQRGGVIVERDVEIGANCTIDRGTIGDTVIGHGSKLDNLIQVGHNVKIGSYCFIVSQTGISGSTSVGDGVTIAGQVGVAGHIDIGDGAQIAAKSGVTKDVEPGTTVFWYPAREQKKARRDIVNIRRISQLKDKVKELEQKIKEMKG